MSGKPETLVTLLHRNCWSGRSPRNDSHPPCAGEGGGDSRISEFGRKAGRVYQGKCRVLC